MKNLAIFSIILISLLFSCQPQEKREYCPTTQNAIVVKKHNPNNKKIYIGTTHVYQNPKEMTGRLYSDAGLVFQTFSLIKKEKVAELPIYAEGVSVGEVATLSNNLLQQIIPQCVIKYYEINTILGIDDRKKEKTLKELEDINSKMDTLFKDHFYVEDNGNFNYRGHVKKALTTEDEKWLREVWYTEVVQKSIQLEQDIRDTGDGIFLCGAYHAIRLSSLDSSVLLAITEEEYKTVYTQLIWDAFVCNYLKLRWT